MTRWIGYALLLIAVATLAVWGFSQFVRPILPASISAWLVPIAAAFTGAAALIAVFKNSIELSRLWTQARDQRFLNESLGRTVFEQVEIERATQNYIRPKCSNLDPAQEQEMRHALVATREDLFAKVDYFLDEDQAHRHLLILADSGTGKTSFVLNYYAYNARRPRKRRHKLAIVPLGIRDADEILNRIPEPSETAVFLDALDEDTRAIKDHRERIRELMASCSRFKRVVITCRTQFFPEDEEIPVETGIARIGPRSAGEKGSYEFVKLYLSPFDDQDVKRYIWRHYPFWKRRERQKAYDLALKIPLLSVRPMLLAHIPEIVTFGVEIKHSYQLYETMVDGWLVRESRWAPKEALRKFSEHLAVDLYLNRAERGMERVPREQLSTLAQTWGIPLDTWQISGRSLLNRDAEGNYKFAHRSVMEYLFTLQLKHGSKQCVGVELTDQMKRFLIEMLISGSPVFPRILQALLPLDWTAECTMITPADMLALQGQLVFLMEALEILEFSRSNPHSLEQALSLFEASQRAKLERRRAYLERRRAELERLLANPKNQRAELERQRAELERLLADPERQRAELERRRAELDRLRANPERQRAELERLLADLERPRAESVRQRAELERLLANPDEQRAELEKRRAELERLLANPDEQRAGLERRWAELERRRAELDRRLANPDEQRADWGIWSQEKSVCIFLERAFGQTITRLCVVIFDEITEHETSALSISVSPTQLDDLKRKIELRSDVEVLYGLDRARMWRLALHFHFHDLSAAQMRSIQTRVRFETTSLESPKYIMRFIA